MQPNRRDIEHIVILLYSCNTLIEKHGASNGALVHDTVMNLAKHDSHDSGFVP